MGRRERCNTGSAPTIPLVLRGGKATRRPNLSGGERTKGINTLTETKGRISETREKTAGIKWKTSGTRERTAGTGLRIFVTGARTSGMQSMTAASGTSWRTSGID